MEVRIGVQNVAREVVLESAQTPEEVGQLVAAAVGGSSPLELVDERGRRIIVPTGVLGYVEIGAPESRRVGFGTA